MYQFDEFAADSLPPDPPTRTEAVMLVQEAAAKDPRFLKFLNEWFPVDHGLRTSDSGMPQEASTISGHQGLDEGLVPTESFKNSQTVATQLSSPMQDLKRERDQTLHEIEELKYQNLLAESRSNYVKYKEARKSKVLETIRSTSHSEEATLYDAEAMFTAAQFDVQCGNTVDMDRILAHRHSVRSAIKEKLDRDMDHLKHEISHSTVESANHQELDSIMIRMKAEVLQYVETTKLNELEIARLELNISKPSEEMKRQAAADVHLRLLTILDDLVTESETYQAKVEVPSEASGKEDLDLELELQNAAEAIARFKSVIATQDREEDVAVDIDRQRALEVLELKHPDSQKLMESSDSAEVRAAHGYKDAEIIGAIHELQMLEDKVRQDQYRTQAAELQSLHAKSSELLQASFVRRSMESPLLSEKDLHEVRDIKVLAQQWNEASLQRQERNKWKVNHEAEIIEQRLQAISQSLQSAEQVVKSVRNLSNLQ